jgi:glycosyltransferase involved in cell wall biosynthesis
MQNIKPPKVSVCIVTYNQEQYIRQCLQSVVDQEVGFEVEIIVSDDCSTDSTPQIIQEFAEKYKNIIPALRQENVGAFRNFVETHNMATGEYVCHLDGDDYWLLGKLEKQSNYLDANPECNIVWTRAKILDEKTGYLYDDRLTEIESKKFYLPDLIEFGSIATHSSKMYRRKLSSFIIQDKAIDFQINIKQIMNGYALILNEILIVYRFGNGISQSTERITQKLQLNYMNAILKEYPQYNKQIASSALFSFLVEIKNFRIYSGICFFMIFLKSKSLKSIISMKKSINIRLMFRCPNFRR